MNHSFWENNNKIIRDTASDYQWGGYNSERFALVIKNAAPFGNNSPLILVCGAGMSKDTLALQKIFKHNATILAVDFTKESVDYQKSLGINSLQVDLLLYNSNWKEMFDIVIDASFTDVFTSDWKENNNKNKAVYNNKALTAIRNIIRYVKKDGLFVVNSIIQTADQYASFMNSATKKLLTYDPYIILESQDIGGGETKRINRWGRAVKGKGSSDGHIGLWYKKSNK